MERINEFDKGIFCLCPKNIFCIGILQQYIGCLFGGKFRSEVIVDEFVGDDFCDFIIEVGREFGVNFKNEAVQSIVIIDIAQRIIMFVTVGSTGAVVSVKIRVADMFLVFLLQSP